MIENYFPGFDPSKNYDQTLFVPRPLQARELNELQLRQDYKLASITNLLFEEGTILAGDVKQAGKQVTFSGLQVYLGGSIRNVPTKTLVISEKGNSIYAILTHRVVTAKDDPDLLEKTPGENHLEEGAPRLGFSIDLVTTPPTASENVKITRIFDLKGGGVAQPKKIFKLPQICEKLAFDEVVPISNLSGMTFRDGTRVLVVGGTHFLDKEPLSFGGANVDITFHHSVKVLARKGFAQDGMVKVNGRVNLRDLQVGWSKTVEGHDAPHVLSVKSNDVVILHGLIEINFESSVTTNCKVMSHIDIKGEYT